MAAYLASRDTYPGGADVVVCTFGDKTFRAGRRTAAHLEQTFERFAVRFPAIHLHIAQTCYHEGYEPSAGTHDGDGVIDFTISFKDGRPCTTSTWWAVQKWFRTQGWDIWFRHTLSWSSPSDWHLHGISEGCPGPVGYLIPSQDTGYKNHRTGLARSVDTVDPSWFPGDTEDRRGTVADILACRFNFEAWEEDHMDDATKNDIADRTADKVVERLLGRQIGDRSKLTIEQILNRLKTFLSRQ